MKIFREARIKQKVQIIYRTQCEKKEKNQKFDCFCCSYTDILSQINLLFSFFFLNLGYIIIGSQNVCPKVRLFSSQKIVLNQVLDQDEYFSSALTKAGHHDVINNPLHIRMGKYFGQQNIARRCDIYIYFNYVFP